MGDEPAWSGTLNLLRIDPLADADAAEGRTFSLDYVRLISGAGTTDSDGDGLPDNVETETFEFVNLRDTGSDPFEADSDSDGFDDGAEILAKRLTGVGIVHRCRQHEFNQRRAVRGFTAFVNQRFFAKAVPFTDIE